MIPLKTIDRVISAIRQDFVDRNMKLGDDPAENLSLVSQLLAIGGISSSDLFRETDREATKIYDKKQYDRWVSIAKEEFDEKHSYFGILSFSAGRNWALNQHASDLENLDNRIKANM